MKVKWFLLLLFSVNLHALAQQPVINAVDTNLIKTLFFAGLKDKLNENYNKANESFGKILAIDPDNAAVYYEIAAMDYRQNKLSEAEAAVKKATALNANNQWYWKLLAELYKRKGDMDALVDVFNQLIRLSPDNDSYYFDRSNAWLLAGKTEDAIKGYDELERKFGSSEALIQARQRIGVEKEGLTKEQIESLLSENEKDVKKLLYTGGVLIRKGQDNEALVVLKKAKDLDPENFEVDLALADIYRALKNDAEANTALKQAFSHSAMLADEKIKIIYSLLASSKDKQATDNAMELVPIVLKAHPDDAKVIALSGEMLYRQGDLKGALLQFKSVLKLTDQDFSVWRQALNIQNDLGLFQEAIKTGNEALSFFPNQAILYYDMAVALFGNAQYEEALINIKMALQLDTDNPLYIENYGDILFLKGDKEGALQQWKKAKASGNNSEKLKKKIDEQTYIK